MQVSIFEKSNKRHQIFEIERSSTSTQILAPRISIEAFELKKLFEGGDSTKGNISNRTMIENENNSNKYEQEQQWLQYIKTKVVQVLKSLQLEYQQLRLFYLRKIGDLQCILKIKDQKIQNQKIELEQFKTKFYCGFEPYELKKNKLQFKSHQKPNIKTRSTSVQSRSREEGDKKNKIKQLSDSPLQGAEMKTLWKNFMNKVTQIHSMYNQIKSIKQDQDQNKIIQDNQNENKRKTVNISEYYHKVASRNTYKHDASKHTDHETKSVLSVDKWGLNESSTYFSTLTSLKPNLALKLKKNSQLNRSPENFQDLRIHSSRTTYPLENY